MFKQIVYYVGLIYLLGIPFNLLVGIYFIWKHKTNIKNIPKKELINFGITILASWVYWIFDKRFTLLD